MSLILVVVFSLPLISHASISTDLSESHGLIQVISPKASLKIDKVKGLDMRVGEKLPLFQENDKYFIVLADDANGQPVLAAFSKMSFQNEATAWVTAQKTLIFAKDVSARSGKLYLRKGENLPVMSEDKKTFEVTISRYGKDHIIEIPKNLRGINFRAYADLPPELQPQKARVRKITLADLPPRKDAPPPKSTAPAPEDSGTSLKESGAELIAAAKSKLDVLLKSQPKPDSETPSTATAKVPPPEEASRTVYYRPKEAYVGDEHQAVRDYSLNLVSALHENSMAINVVLVILLVIAGGYARHQKGARQPARSAPTPDVHSEATAPAAPTQEAAPAEASQPSTFTGSLEVFNIKDLIQFLHNSSSTGVLNLEVDGVSSPGRVILNMGEVKHATFNGAEGNSAFIQIFGIHRGSFRFQLSQQIKTKETIYTETSELIDETAKMVQLQNEQKIINFGTAG